MNLATVFAVFAVKGSDAPEQGDPPSGEPSGLILLYYGSPNKIRARWTNGDATAYTKIYAEEGTCPDTPQHEVTVGPGVTSYDSTLLQSNDPHTWQLSHYKNGQESDKTSCQQSG